ncbi:MAG: alternative ribosome rescue aminoacyl-tRNA hydrolase ArfB [Actinomycetota bacterium]
MGDDVRVGRSLTIPTSEIEFNFTPSGGPGGQHANRSSTRVELLWNVDESQVLTPTQRARIRHALRTRIDSSGTLRLASSAQRSQTRNREDVIGRLARLVADALKPRRQRVPTRASKASKERRLQDKKHRGEVKRLRKPDFD